MEQSEFERVRGKQRSGKSKQTFAVPFGEASLHLYQSPLYQRKTLSVRFGRARGHGKWSITVMKAHELFTGSININIPPTVRDVSHLLQNVPVIEVCS